ncbi:hypothetical protein PBR20603_01657 [Pandoraea bronchicola]|uniref:Uncharacterized protein n=1 Tax=Pandoraea bronchicola TaxID=2508287 RepID=A0A5E5BPC8_9BURK|nr:hypothetical protein PBR20603_01657 [Pandoraea bronchicola]
MHTVFMIMRRRNPTAPERRALTPSDLRAIWARTPTPEVRELLWEIHRLHVTLVACRVDVDIIRGEWKQEVEGWLVAIESLRARLLDEPCVAGARVNSMRSAREQGERDAAEHARPRQSSGKGSCAALCCLGVLGQRIWIPAPFCLAYSMSASHVRNSTSRRNPTNWHVRSSGSFLPVQRCSTRSRVVALS